MIHSLASVRRYSTVNDSHFWEIPLSRSSLQPKMIYIPSTRLYSSGNSVAKEGKRAISDALSPPSPFLSPLSPSSLSSRRWNLAEMCIARAHDVYTGALTRSIQDTTCYKLSSQRTFVQYVIFSIPGRLSPPSAPTGPDSFSPRVSRSSDFHIEGNRASPWIHSRSSLPGEIISS